MACRASTAGWWRPWQTFHKVAIGGRASLPPWLRDYSVRWLRCDKGFPMCAPKLSYGHCLAVVRYEFFQCVARDGDVFRMHFMPFYFFIFSPGLKVSGLPTWECQFFQFYSFIAQCVQYAWGEMQSRCRGSHRTFDFGIDSLVSLLVTFLGFPVQVGRDGQFDRRPRECRQKSLPDYSSGSLPNGWFRGIRPVRRSG